MPIFLSHVGAIAQCQRCQIKTPYTELREDGNIQGLYVCRREGCWDPISDFRKPPRPPDNYTLAHPRPSQSLAVTTRYIIDGNGNVITTTNNLGIEPSEK